MTPAPISADRLRELLDKANGLPWRWSENGNIVPLGYPHGEWDFEIAAVYTERNDDEAPANAELIIEAVNALPALLQQLAEREAEVERLQAELDFMTAHYERMTSHMVCHRGALIYANAGMRDAYSEEHVRAEAAERAREAARILIEDAGSALRVIIATAEAARWPITAEQMVPLNMARKEADRIAAFLAANGGRDHG